MIDIKKVCICGGGNLGIVCAGVFLSKGIKVSILSGHPEKWSKEIRVFDQGGNVFSGELEVVTNKPEKAAREADIILLTVPGYLIENTLETIKPFIGKFTLVGSIVSSTGFFFAAHKILDESTGLFGFQRVPFISRQRKYGEVGDLLGYKPQLNVAIENIEDKERFANIISALFNTPTKVLNNFYEASLTNSNPILHTARLYSMWKDYQGTVFTQPIKFYADWTDEASHILLEMDAEFGLLLEKLNVSRQIVPSLLDYYQCDDSTTLSNKIRSIPAFRTIDAPMIETDNGWIPNFNSRYFKEDFPFGLRYIWQLAKENNVPIPMIDKVYGWGMNRIQ